MKEEDKSKQTENPVVLVGYSGHAFVVCDILSATNIGIHGYCEIKQKSNNPYKLQYLGSEQDNGELLTGGLVDVFVAVGDNKTRQSISNNLEEMGCNFANAAHDGAFISQTSKLGKGVMIGVNAIINACTIIGDGVVCNSGSIIEHDCVLRNFVHIAPGAVLCGNVEIGERSFIGAGSVVKEGIKIGKDVTVGAGSVIIRDIPDNTIVVGNPQRII